MGIFNTDDYGRGGETILPAYAEYPGGAEEMMLLDERECRLGAVSVMKIAARLAFRRRRGARYAKSKRMDNVRARRVALGA